MHESIQNGIGDWPNARAGPPLPMERPTPWENEFEKKPLSSLGQTKRPHRRLEGADDRVRAFLRQLAESKRLLGYRKDWDDRGSPGFSSKTWHAAYMFAANHLTSLVRNAPETVDLPEIEPGTDGDLFINWETDTFRILIRIPPEGEGEGDYYGDDYEKTSVIKDTVDPLGYDANLAGWLSKQLAGDR